MKSTFSFFVVNLFFVGAFFVAALVAIYRQEYAILAGDCFFLLLNSLCAIANGASIYERIK